MYRTIFSYSPSHAGWERMVLAGPIASAICGLTLFPGIPSSLVGSFIICSPTDASQMWNHWGKCLGCVFRPHRWFRYFLDNGLLGKHPLKSYLLPCIHVLIYLILKQIFFFFSTGTQKPAKKEGLNLPWMECHRRQRQPQVDGFSTLPFLFPGLERLGYCLILGLTFHRDPPGILVFYSC